LGGTPRGKRAIEREAKPKGHRFVSCDHTCGRENDQSLHGQNSIQPGGKRKPVPLPRRDSLWRSSELGREKERIGVILRGKKKEEGEIIMKLEAQRSEPNKLQE